VPKKIIIEEIYDIFFGPFLSNNVYR